MAKSSKESDTLRKKLTPEIIKSLAKALKPEKLMGSKNKEWADAFHQFCMDNPQLRFWQALLAWAKKDVDPTLGYIYTAPSADMYDLKDTFYMETTESEKEPC